MKPACQAVGIKSLTIRGRWRIVGAMAPPKRKGGRTLPATTTDTTTSSRVTKKVEPGARAVATDGDSADGTAPSASGRYTPPARAQGGGTMNMPSPRWVPVLMFSLLGIGTLLIILNYLELLPGAPSNWYLVGGLVGVLSGIVTATQYR
jgi:hypothetical protein